MKVLFISIVNEKGGAIVKRLIRLSLFFVGGITTISIVALFALIVIYSETAITDADTTTTVNDSNWSIENSAVIADMEILMSAYDLPSVSIAVAVNGEMVLASARGYANVADGISATPATMYSIGSIAKPMTAVAMMRYWDRGIIDLDSPIAARLPEWPGRHAAITPRQLASHSAGIPHVYSGRASQELISQEIYNNARSALSVFADESLLFEPGQDFTYSSSGYTLLSAWLEAVAGQDWQDLMDAEVWRPLMMTSTVLHRQPRQKQEAQDYMARISENTWLPRIPTERSFMFGGGAVLSSPVDLVRFALGVMNDDFLSPESRSLMWQPVALPMGEGESVINAQNYGLGWRSDETPGSSSITGVHHGGTVAGGASSFLLLYPQFNAVIAIATNAATPPELRAAMWRILRSYISTDSPREPSV
ncbi:MAG: beta-lactamase family protein [Gammaproteobacteria bacterium]|nr:beta-lactamase family protein [Gammaproteobacteria bacterium]